MSPPPEPTPEVAAPPAPRIEAASLAEGRALAIPGPEGFLATWRRVASSAESGARASDEPTPSDAEHETAELVSFHTPRMRLDRAASHSAHQRVTLGATLLVPHDTTSWLLVGLTGEVTVHLNGRAVGHAESPDRYRRDRLLVELELPAGEHQLTLTFDKPAQGRWYGAIRWLDARFRPGLGNVAVALGRPDAADVEQLRANAVELTEHHELIEGSPSVRLTASLPAGSLRGPTTVTLDEETGTLDPGSGPATMEVVRTMPQRGVLDLAVTIGPRSERAGRRIQSDRSALRAVASLTSVLEDAPENARAPIAWRRDELQRVVAAHDGDQRWRNLLQAETRRISRSIARGRDPFERIRGYERMAFFSRLDDTPQHYELFVPPGYHPRRGWPLLITLHGYKGNAGDYFRNTFGLARNYAAGESLLAHGRHGVAPTSGPMIVIGPDGRGQSFYRHAGEIDVLEAIEDVRRRFHIDERRIYITGGSMGGTGAAYLPFRHPDLFAASAALAGYHDQRVRVDTDHDALDSVERFLQARRSDVDWAQNASHLPMLLVRGTRDRPLEWTRRLAARLASLDYRHEHREPELGHNVWNETYADGAIFRYLGRYRRPNHPRHVTLRTARERTLAAYWVRIEQREAADRFAHVDARIANGTVRTTIEGARAVTFSPPAPLLAEGAPLTIEVGEQTITGLSPLTIEAFEGGWRAATRPWPEEDTRRPGWAGPIRDVYHEPLTFVVGTQDPDHTFINRLVAERWAHPRGWMVDYPIVDDVDVTDEMIAERTLVLIGPPESNTVHARMAEDLPIRVVEEGVTVGDRVHRGRHVGAVFVARSPLAPNRGVLVIAGAEPLGTFHATELPDILPDYVVFDERVTASRDRWACGGTGCEYLAHGFFDMHMQMPATTEPPSGP